MTEKSLRATSDFCFFAQSKPKFTAKCAKSQDCDISPLLFDLTENRKCAIMKATRDKSRVCVAMADYFPRHTPSTKNAFQAIRFRSVTKSENENKTKTKF